MKAQMEAGDPDTIWREAAANFWDRIIGVGGFEACTDPSEVTQTRDQCRAFCAAQGEPNQVFPGPEPLDVCRNATGTLRAFMMPSAQNWLELPSIQVLEE